MALDGDATPTPRLALGVRHDGGGVTASRDRGLPYGTVARVLLAWMYAETTRTGDNGLGFGASYRALVEALEFDAPELEDQLMRLSNCYLETRVGRGPMLTWMILSWPEGATDRRFPDEEAIILTAHPFTADIRRHPLTLCTETLRTLRDRPLALDLYLWKRYHASQPRTFTSLRLYHELAEAPSAMPTPRELEAFERQASFALKGVAAPSELFSHPLPEPGQTRAYPRVLRRHREGPLAEERTAYLSELAAQCVAPATLIK